MSRLLRIDIRNLPSTSPQRGKVKDTQEER